MLVAVRGSPLGWETFPLQPGAFTSNPCHWTSHRLGVNARVHMLIGGRCVGRGFLGWGGVGPSTTGLMSFLTPHGCPGRNSKALLIFGAGYFLFWGGVL